MHPKPEHFRALYAEAFKDQQVVESYRYRPPYPDEVFAILETLIEDTPRIVLDVGTGSGDIARSLVNVVERIDAVDCSQPMIEQGRRLPNGDHPHVHWIFGKVEEVPLAPPYALITAGSSIHWTEWEVAFPRFCSLLTRNGSLALVYRNIFPMPWDAEFRELRARFSTRQDHERSHVVTELEARSFLHKRGERKITPVPFLQPIDDFIAGLHARSGFSRQRMGEQQAEDFDRQVKSLLLAYHSDGILPMQSVATVTWGIPDRGPTG